ncbi:hypothetical protein H5410_060064 [Solanum commersonii]|uniref:Uncharacterized protein n=1 Tax=Solanum commersonii TaxID=4109 RepID=A0A9J5W468_SOLCO|nr:hypothetical protein H5410_060064 [Solanum commersonii]
MEESQMKDYFIRAQEPQYYDRMMLVAEKSFADMIKLESMESLTIDGVRGYLKSVEYKEAATSQGLVSSSSSWRRQLPAPVVAMTTTSLRSRQLGAKRLRRGNNAAAGETTNNEHWRDDNAISRKSQLRPAVTSIFGEDKVQTDLFRSVRILNSSSRMKEPLKAGYRIELISV